MLCENYRGITLLNVVCKLLSTVLLKRINIYAEEIMREYQCGFRSDRSTTDQIFTLRQTLEKCHEHGIDLHLLFIDFKQAFDSVNSKEIYEALETWYKLKYRYHRPKW
jgi:hypothetical protein